MKTALSFTSVTVVALSLLGLVTACQSTSVGSGTAPQKEALLVQSRIQGENCDHSQTARTSKRAACRQGFDRRIQRKLVLRISDCDEEPDTGWESNAVQCLQTGCCGIWPDDKPQFRARHARAASHSHPAVRWFRSAWGVITFVTGHRKPEIYLAGVAELADAPDLGSGGEIRRGSSPLPGT